MEENAMQALMVEYGWCYQEALEYFYYELNGEYEHV